MSAGQTTTGEQFYVTHCATADSVMLAPGYSVRAASSAGDADELKAALEFPPYELPLEMWKAKPAKADTPRRLARVMRDDGGGVWVVHSVFLEKDTMNRDRSYFSHLLHLKDTSSAADALESWAADTWATEYPPGAAKTLPRGKLPSGTAINAATLTAFLAHPQAGPSEISVAVCPARIRSRPDARRELVAKFLKGFLLTDGAKDAEKPRDRLFVHAEPGLVAMLTYAAARILPPAYTANLTFTTFEPAHRGLRDYKLATVIGTYLGAPGKGLDADLTTTRGYGLDTIQPERSSKELIGDDLPAGLSELIDLAAAGEWDLLADVHRLVGSEADSFAQVPRTIPLARAVRRLNEGTLTADDLLALKADRRGNAVLTQRTEKVWAFLRVPALTDERLRAAFKDWLSDPARLTEYRREASEALIHGNVAAWDERWAIIRGSAEPEQLRLQADKAQKSLDKYLPNLIPAARDRLRSACADAGVFPDHHLLAPTGSDELNILLSPTTPPEWQGYTCFAVMGPDDKNWLLPSTAPYRTVMRARVRKHLLAAPATVLAGYIRKAKPFVTSDPVFLYDLLRPFRPDCPGFMSRLIDAGAEKIEASDWVKLLGELDVYGERTPEWQGFLLKNDHLAKLLAGFKADPAATPVWAGYLGLLSEDLLNGDVWEMSLYDQLSKAKVALGAAGIPLRVVLPEGGPAKLNAADTILAVRADISAAESLEPGQLSRAFEAYGVHTVDGLRKFYVAGNFAVLDPAHDSEAAQLAAFVNVFRACYPVTNESSARSAVTAWLTLSNDCNELFRVAFQLHFVLRCVPKEYHQQLVDGVRQFPFLPEADARIREGLAVAPKRSAERYDRPAPSRSSNDDEDAGFASEATKKARKAKGGAKGSGGKTRRNREAGGISTGVVIVGILLMAAVIAVILVVIKFAGSSPKPTEPDTTPTKAEKPKIDDKGKEKPKKDKEK